jgi:hypothetical protein
MEILSSSFPHVAIYSCGYGHTYQVTECQKESPALKHSGRAYASVAVGGRTAVSTFPSETYRSYLNVASSTAYCINVLVSLSIGLYYVACLYNLIH